MRGDEFPRVLYWDIEIKNFISKISEEERDIIARQLARWYVLNEEILILEESPNNILDFLKDIWDMDLLQDTLDNQYIDDALSLTKARLDAISKKVVSSQ